jgi:hypothetical protein
LFVVRRTLHLVVVLVGIPLFMYKLPTSI